MGSWYREYRSLLESDVGVGNQERTQNSVHDGVERAGGEGSNGEGDQTDADSPEESFVSIYLLHRIGNCRCMTNRSKVQW